MTRRLPPVLGFAAVVAAVACVEIATGPNGVVSIGLTPRPPQAIILGDTLRDSTGAVLRLQPVGFGTDGKPVAELPFRYIALPIGGDTTVTKPVALTVDSTTGLLRAPSPWLDDSGRVAIRLGDRLQIVDTFAIVPRPTTLARALTGTATTLPRDSTQFYYDCRVLGDLLTNEIVPDDTTSRVYRGVPFGTVTTIGTRFLTGDSVKGVATPVRRYLVQYRIDSVISRDTNVLARIPTVTLSNGSTRPAIGLITRSSSVTGTPDTPIRFDTTDANGGTTVRLRIFPSALNAKSVLADSLIRVVVRAVAQVTPTSAVVDTSRAIVLLHRIVRSPSDNSVLSCAAP